jgi:4-hydroxymandelate oxidase
MEVTMVKWICTVCNHVHEGETPPAFCPVCGVGPDKFVQGADDAGNEVSLFAEPQTLEDVRGRAREKLRGLCGVYKACDGQPDRLCQNETYGAPIGLGGAGAGAGFAANVNSLARLQLRMKLVGDHFVPDSRFDFFGKVLDMPIMGASTAGPGRYTEAMSEQDFCQATLRGCRLANTITWRGDTFFYTLEDHPGLNAIEAENGNGVPIFKPRAQDALKQLIERAEKAGCPAVGIDLDGCGSTIMARHGQPVFRKNAKELQALIDGTSLPFIVKGIMDPDDAEACVDAGAKVVSVSNHGGRVLDSTPGVADALPRIVERIGGKALITADGGVRTGYDVFKMLALGADAVLIGRDVIRAAIGAGDLGVKMHMTHLHKVLQRTMFMTGCPTLESIGSHVFTR